MSETLDLWRNPAPVCPHCGAERDVDGDWWADHADTIVTEEDFEIDCEACMKTFWVRPIADYTYTTSGSEGELT